MARSGGHQRAVPIAAFQCPCDPARRVARRRDPGCTPRPQTQRRGRRRTLNAAFLAADSARHNGPPHDNPPHDSGANDDRAAKYYATRNQTPDGDGSDYDSANCTATDYAPNHATDDHDHASR